MPELPEVETIKNQLQTILPLSLKDVQQSSKCIKMIKRTDLDWETLVEKKMSLQEVQRHGKWLIFSLSPTVQKQKFYLLSHLGMSGRWQIGQELSLQKHVHLCFKGKNQVLSYCDPRRFGHIYILNQDNLKAKLESLGPDLTDKKVNADYLKAVFRRHPKHKLKVLLLKQRYFAGIGNYMANEICAHAGILPHKNVEQIEETKFPVIIKAIQKVLKVNTQTGGNTFQGGYVDAFGQAGKALQHLVVFYQKQCQLCKKTKVIKTILAQRGTYYCSNCQK